ncbi:glycosyltransferase [Pseudotabrizicola sp. L79]|uniref:glycosyltransferase n=1 Tax=Pseudotabrizicola sp. L79 TaxID=3118402 RepID=UPI002F91C407
MAPFLQELRARLGEAGRSLCVITPPDDLLWRSPEIVGAVDQFVVTMYDEPWLGSLPGPLASEPWFEATVVEIARRVGKDRLIVALGSRAVDWKSGQATPETISYAEAMSRISRYGASPQFAGTSRNSTASYTDESGVRHRIWMLDAVTTHNSLRIIEKHGIQNVALATMGEEDSSLWTLFDKAAALPAAERLKTVTLPDYVAYRGEGSFYRLVQKDAPGTRVLMTDPISGHIVSADYSVLPRPSQMERFGISKTNQVALTFDDGPDPVATAQILDALRDTQTPASFFVVGRAALSAPKMLERAAEEGHLIGLHTFFHPRMEDVTPLRALTEINAVRNLVEGMTGFTPVLYRPPYGRGPGPIEGRIASSFAMVESEGLVIAGADIVPPDWNGISADAMVQQVLTELDKEGGNVIVLHDGRSEGMHTAEAVRKLVPALRAAGYEIVPLATILGTTVEALMPPAERISAAFNGTSFRFIGGVFGLVLLLFWLTLIASFVRAYIYLRLARHRDLSLMPPLRSLPSVTVVIPAFNEEVVVLQSVLNVLQCDYPDLKVIVVDDGSTDRTAELVSRHFGQHPQVRLIKQANQGKWRALNAALAMIETEIAVCVDADSRIAHDALRHLVHPFLDWRVGAVAGTVVVANRYNLLTRMQAVEYTTAQQIGRRAHEVLDGIMVVPGALGAWRVDALRDVGGYSNETLTEDADLTLTIRRAGYRVAYAEDALSYTEAPSDVRSFIKQRLRWSLGNLQTLWKHRGVFGEWGPRKLFSMVDMILFGYVLPLLAPLLDIMFLWFAFVFGSAWLKGEALEIGHMPPYALAVLIAIPFVDLFVAWRALRYDGREKLSLLFVVPLMNFALRPLLYIAVYRAMWSAVSGRLAGWNKLRRQGLAAPKAKAPV